VIFSKIKSAQFLPPSKISGPTHELLPLKKILVTLGISYLNTPITKNQKPRILDN